MKNQILDAFVVAALAMAVFVASGCSQFQARGTAGVEIDNLSAAAPTISTQAQTGQLTPAQVQSYLASNAVAMDGWYGTATTNWFAYAFGPKMIYATPAYVSALGQYDTLFAKAKAWSATQPADGPVYLIREEASIQKVKAAKDAKAPPGGAK